MSSHSGKSTPDKGVDKLADQLKNTLNTDKDDNANKPDFRERDTGSPVTPLRTASGPAATTTSSSSSSSGSVSGRAGPKRNTQRKSESNPSSHSGSESSPSRGRNVRKGHVRSQSCGSHHLSSSGSGSVSSPPPPIPPGGNICPSGKVVPGMASKQKRPDVLGFGLVNHGHGSIMRGTLPSKSGAGIGSASYPRKSMAFEPPKKMELRNSNDPEELKIFGNEYYKSGDFAEALHLYERAIAISPRDASHHFNRAAALVGVKRLVEAVGECEEAVRLDPGYSKAHYKLGSLLLSLGQVEDARKHIYLSGHQSDPTEMQKLQLVEKHLSRCSAARAVGDWLTTLKEADATIISGADSSPQLCACKAEALLKLHQVDDAFSAVLNLPISDPVTTTNPDLKIFGMIFDAYTFFVKAQVELTKGRFDNAIRAIEKAGQTDPVSTEVINLLKKVRLVCRARTRGNDLFKSDRFTEACTAYGEGLRHDPSNSVLYCNRAACWFKVGQWEKSVDDCNQALRFQPNYLKALLRRAAANSKLERWSEAVSDYGVLRRELPNDNEVAESLFHAQVGMMKSCGEDVSNMKFGGEVESVSGLEQFRAAISFPGASVVHFKIGSNSQCKKISPSVDALCSRYPSVNFLQVDIVESPAIARAEKVLVVPTFKIYRKGDRVKEMICPDPKLLESSVRHYSI